MVRWLFKQIVIVVGLVMMAVCTLLGLIGRVFDVKEIIETRVIWELTWYDIAFVVLAVSFWLVVIKLIMRLNKYEKLKPRLSTRLMPFPESGTRILRITQPARSSLFTPQVGYAKIAIKNAGGLLENCIGTVTGIAKVSVQKNQINIIPLILTASQLFWDDKNVFKNIPNDGVERYLNLAYLDQNKPGSWQLAIDEQKREDYFAGWHKIDVTISSVTSLVEPLKLEMALALGEREIPASGLNLWPWDKWYETREKELQQASHKEGYQP